MSAFDGLSVPEQVALEGAWAALAADGLAVGSAISGRQGQLLGAGRNHAYDKPSGSDVLERTPLAHAELNALARIDTDVDLEAATLWSTQRPCSMCTAAAAFVGVGTIRFLAEDPWAIAAGVPTATTDRPAIIGPAGPRWQVVATSLFLLSIARTRGPDHPTIVGLEAVDPEVVAFIRSVVSDAAPLEDSLERFLVARGSVIETLTRARTAAPIPS